VRHARRADTGLWTNRQVGSLSPSLAAEFLSLSGRLPGWDSVQRRLRIASDDWVRILRSLLERRDCPRSVLLQGECDVFPDVSAWMTVQHLLEHRQRLQRRRERICDIRGCRRYRIRVGPDFSGPVRGCAAGLFRDRLQDLPDPVHPIQVLRLHQHGTQGRQRIPVPLNTCAQIFEERHR